MHNIILIGMPGVGKSTIGVVLAKRLGYQFEDSDLIIQNQTGQLLHEIITERGIDGFVQLENDVNAGLDLNQTILATGGSAIYGEGAMKHFASIGKVVYLKLPFEELSERLGDLTERGVVLKENQTLEDLLIERSPYYEKYADVTIECKGKEIRTIVEEIGEWYAKL